MSRTHRLLIMMALMSGVVLPFRAVIAAEPASIRSHIHREPLASTALLTAGYSKRLHIMEIEFSSGAVYRYLDVPPDVYHHFMSADSKAQYYDWNIKGHYRALRLEPADHSVAR